MQAFLRLILFCGALFFCISNTKAQTACTWQQGELLTYIQTDWGDEQTSAGILLDIGGGFNQLYPTDMVIGTPNSLRFSNASTVFAYLPAIGPANVLTATIQNPLSTSAGELGGEVAALKLNIDFSDAGLLGGSTRLGDLVIHDISVTAANGQTVRQFFATASTILGGNGSGVPYTPSIASAIARQINNAFLNGTPSQFALDNLKRVWQQGDMFTRSQLVWNGDVTWYQDYNSVYASQSGIVEVGIHGNAGYSLQFAAGDEVNAFFIQSGTPAALNADLFSTTGSSSGQFGGEVLALRLNIDFSDAGFLSGNSSVPFGDLILYDLASFNAAPLPEFDGLSVREVIAIANFMLGGGSSTFEFSTITHLVAALNASFLNGTPSQFALDHLKRGWQQGDMFTRAQLDWDGTDSWFVDYDAVYASTFGLMQIGVPGASGYDIRFSAPNTLQNFFVQTGIPAALNADLLDPTSSASRQFGGEVAALRLNIDFSDAGFLSGNSTVHFGDLILHNLGQLSDSPAPELDGLSVKEVSTIANFMLGGGSSTFEISTIDNVVAYLNASFVNGTPSRFAKNHLALPCNITAPNHCPVTSSSSVTTPINTAFNVALQATDEDNDVLSYSISQNPLHGTVTTSSTGAASYTPTAGYYGADEFKFKASDGKCDAEGTVTITIVMCPKGKGSWKNDPGAWPSGSTPMVLGSVSYTQAQLITILNTSPGTGNKADASLILAHQLIAARLSIANGSPSAPIAATITHADGLLAVYQGVLPYKVKPNTPAGQAMIADAIILENYNNGLMTTGCSPTPALTRTNTTAINETSIDESNGWQVKLFPNPSANSFSITVHADAKEKIMMQVIDMYGRIIETRNVNANSTIRIGDKYRPGTYFVKIIQGKEHKELKLIKLSD